MELNDQHKQQLSKLLAQPWLVMPEHAEMLHGLTQKYPYYQQLYLLLAKAESNTPEASKSLTKAAIYNNGTILHRLINDPKSLKKLNEIEIVKYKSVTLVGSHEGQAELDDAHHLAQQEESVSHYEKTEAPIETIVPNTELDEQEVFEEISELIIPKATETLQENPIHVVENIPVIETIDSTNTHIPQEHYADFLEEPSSEYASMNNTIIEEKAVSDHLEPESLANTDFFYFDKDFVSEKVEEETASNAEETTAALNTIEPQKDNTHAEANVSKYDDDQLPFTFLWWLAKTRKHYEAVFRPFVTQRTSTENVGSELQQQYVEHIFHAQSPLEEDGNSTITGIATKENELINNFIKNDPQIKPLKPDQINNENKAKKSAEDNYDLVSETLASIYIEQMLYHKAIDTYQKLSLKFPEKSRYFADLIQSLEKKI